MEFFCITPHTEVMLARPTDPSFDRITMRSAASGAVVKLDWANAAKQLAWPAGLPLEPGMVQVSSDRTGAEHRLEFRAWPISGPGDTARTAGLALAGCRPQATVALDQLRDAVAPLDLYLDFSRGRYPTYHAGEPVEFVLQTNRDAYLYCLIRDRDGHLSPCFLGNRAKPGFWPPHAAICPAARCRRPCAPVPSLTVARSAASRPSAIWPRSCRCWREPAVVPLLPEDTVTALDRAIADSAHGRVVMAQLILRIEE